MVKHLKETSVSCSTSENTKRQDNRRVSTTKMPLQDKDGRAHAADRVVCQLTVKFSTFYMER